MRLPTENEQNRPKNSCSSGSCRRYHATTQLPSEPPPPQRSTTQKKRQAAVAAVAAVVAAVAAVARIEHPVTHHVARGQEVDVLAPVATVISVDLHFTTRTIIYISNDRREVSITPPTIAEESALHHKRQERVTKTLPAWPRGAGGMIEIECYTAVQ